MEANEFSKVRRGITEQGNEIMKCIKVWNSLPKGKVGRPNIREQICNM